MRIKKQIKNYYEQELKSINISNELEEKVSRHILKRETGKLNLFKQVLSYAITGIIILVFIFSLKLFQNNELSKKIEIICKKEKLTTKIIMLNKQFKDFIRKLSLAE